MGQGCLSDYLVRTASRYAEKRAISFLRHGEVETEISYRDLDQDSNQLANTLVAQGIGRGDRVILFLPKSLLFVTAHLAIQKIGAISVPLNPGFKKSEMSYFIHDVRPKLVMSGPAQESMVKDIAPPANTLLIAAESPYEDLSFFRSAPEVMPQVETGTEDPGLIIYTSGTTGKPKGAILSQKNLVHDAMNIIRIWEIRDSDVLCHALPLFHVHGLCFALHTSLIAGSHVIMLDEFSPEMVLDLLGRREGEYACTVFMAVPAMYSKLTEYLGERRQDFEHIRLWTSGSAPLLPKDFEKIRRVFGKEPVEREGMSETGMNFSNPLRGLRKPGSIGMPLPDLEVRIVNLETFQDVKPGEEGEIWLRGPGVTPGYWEKPEETAEALVEGWFRTGDLGRMDEDGYYYITDRIKHIIISGGENISPKEIEDVINQLGEVVESSVVGLQDEKWGERVVAAVVKRPGSLLTPHQIQVHCKEHLHNWKCPKEVLFLKQLPKNTMGKVLKEEVKKVFTGGYSRASVQG
jgi:malonyl-CoA/methylmalonyl-CoA synthetase